MEGKIGDFEYACVNRTFTGFVFSHGTKFLSTCFKWLLIYTSKFRYKVFITLVALKGYTSVK